MMEKKKKKKEAIDRLLPGNNVTNLSVIKGWHEARWDSSLIKLFSIVGVDR